MLHGVLAALAVAATSALADAALDSAAIRQRLLDWTAAFNARDAAGACDLFAPDLAYALPDAPTGTQATICGNFARIFARPGLNRTRRRWLIRQGPRSRWQLIRTPGEPFGRQARRRGTAGIDPA